MRWIRSAVIAGNMLFILWVSYNAIDEGGKGVSMIEAASLIGLVILLLLNCLLLWRSR
jgi:hypothetical protein